MNKIRLENQKEYPEPGDIFKEYKTEIYYVLAWVGCGYVAVNLENGELKRGISNEAKDAVNALDFVGRDVEILINK